MSFLFSMLLKRERFGLQAFTHSLTNILVHCSTAFRRHEVYLLAFGFRPIPREYAHIFLLAENGETTATVRYFFSGENSVLPLLGSLLSQVHNIVSKLYLSEFS